MQRWSEILHFSASPLLLLHLLIATGYLAKLHRCCFTQRLPNSSLWRPSEISFFHIIPVTAVLGASFYPDQSSGALQGRPFRAVPTLCACPPALPKGCWLLPQQGRGLLQHPWGLWQPPALMSPLLLGSLTRDAWVFCKCPRESGRGRAKRLCDTLSLQKLPLALTCPFLPFPLCVLSSRRCEPRGTLSDFLEALPSRHASLS